MKKVRKPSKGKAEDEKGKYESGSDTD